MTPQLQQAIKLLQLSTLDLQLEIQQALDSNPMLEIEDDGAVSLSDLSEREINGENTESPVGESINLDGLNSDGLGSDGLGSTADTLDGDYNADTEYGSDTDYTIDTEFRADIAAETPGEQEWSDVIPTDLPVDTSWEDVYQTTPASTQSGSDDDREYERNGTTESLQEHLLWQLNLTTMSDTDRLIGMAIIDAVSPSGMLSISAAEIHSGFEEGSDIELDEVIAVLHLVQQFDPVGSAAHDLSECLLIQLNQYSSAVPHLSAAKTIVAEYLPLLANRDYKQIMRKTRLSEEELKAAIDIIQDLNPRPGEQIASASTEYVIPDVFVRKIHGRWLVELNPEIAPKVRINADYASLVKRADSSADNTFLRDNLQEARWFLKSLQSRNETLMKVATQIVEHQRGFLEYGDEAMKPLVLHDIAEAVEMHESTISRVTTQKYMHTPRGIFELKYFFSSHVNTSSGGECSSTAIRAMIRKLVAEEDTKKPMSDSKISKLLEDQGIEVARRTIAKYRESLSIPPSNERKRLV